MLERYEFCAFKIAQFAVADMLGEVETKAFEGSMDDDGSLRPLVLMTADYIAEDCAAMFDLVANSMLRHEQNLEDCPDCYAIPPYGLNSSFGYDGPTAAWMFLSEQAPSLIFRSCDNDSIIGYLSRFVEYWIEAPQPRSIWPKANTINQAFDIPKLKPGRIIQPPIPRHVRRHFLAKH